MYERSITERAHAERRNSIIMYGGRKVHRIERYDSMRVYRPHMFSNSIYDIYDAINLPF